MRDYVVSYCTSLTHWGINFDFGNYPCITCPVFVTTCSKNNHIVVTVWIRVIESCLAFIHGDEQSQSQDSVSAWYTQTLTGLSIAIGEENSSLFQYTYGTRQGCSHNGWKATVEFLKLYYTTFRICPVHLIFPLPWKHGDGKRKSTSPPFPSAWFKVVRLSSEMHFALVSLLQLHLRRQFVVSQQVWMVWSDRWYSHTCPFPLLPGPKFHPAWCVS